MTSTAVEVAAVRSGMGRHRVYLSAGQEQQVAKLGLISMAFCTMSGAMCKVSICASFLRFLKGTQALLQRAFLYSVAAIVLTVNATVVTTLFIQCRPLSKEWNPDIKGSCWSLSITADLLYFQGGQLTPWN